MFYEDASLPFTERKRKIEAGEEPFVPSYGYEDDEPAFLEEWGEADEALDLLGQMCISVLAASLQLYVKSWIDDRFRRYGQHLAERGIVPPDRNSPAFKQGWINGYRAFFRDQLGIDWADGPSNLGVLEEIALARNRVQHPEEITSLRVRQSKKDQAKYPRSFFADEFELRAWGDRSLTSEFVPPVRLNVTRDRLFAAIDEVEAFCSWLDEQAPIGASPSSNGQ
jgi:hypothetical protein